MTQTIKFGIIGVGGMGQSYVNYLKNKTTGAEVVAIADANPQKLTLVGEKFQIKTCFTNYRDLLNEKAIQAVYIATPNCVHREQAVAALDAGKDVFLEKPVAMNTVEVRDILDRAGRSDRIFAVDFPMRHTKSAVLLKQMITAGELGEIYYAKTSYLRRNLIPGMGGWFTCKKMSGGGPMIDLGVHILDRMFWLMGAPRPVAVTGAVFNHLISQGTAGEWPPKETRAGDAFNNPVDVEDLAAACVRFENGALLMVEASWAGYSHEGMLSEWLGTKAGAREDSGGFKVFGSRNGLALDITPDMKSAPAPLSPIEQFMVCVRERRAPAITAAELLGVSRIIEAVYQSAQTGREVRIG